MFKKRKSKGRQKIEIKKIEKEEARQICFSKRKAGIFKKANELAVLCGAEVGIVAFSPAGKAFSFGHPNIHPVIDRYLAAGEASTTQDLYLHHPGTYYVHEANMRDLQREHEDLVTLVTAVKRQQGEMKKKLWWDDIEGLGVEDLMEYVKVLEQLKMKHKLQAYLPYLPFSFHGPRSSSTSLAHISTRDWILITRVPFRKAKQILFFEISRSWKSSQKFGGDISVEGPNFMDQDERNSMPSFQQEEEAIKKKYGGILPKKQPLISKDHERAFFDSADWALGKQGAHVEKPKGPLEALRPKLQPTPQQQVRSRRSAYASNENEDGGNTAIEDANMNE
ncbi:hypothetical protein J5N97_007575 [Dioscorea zingiberensis]|uniref:MADS-box domain-containing protein n=1 Tax=Dioscorea zingiberensis TaxID=325984 RepID=A0A9D5DCW2_9LILI|nr:hypothetical protein J5N97_007575 [Dioscorea zingiberensis]